MHFFILRPIYLHSFTKLRTVVKNNSAFNAILIFDTSAVRYLIWIVAQRDNAIHDLLIMILLSSSF